MTYQQQINAYSDNGILTVSDLATNDAEHLGLELFKEMLIGDERCAHDFWGDLSTECLSNIVNAEDTKAALATALLTELSEPINDDLEMRRAQMSRSETAEPANQELHETWRHFERTRNAFRGEFA